MARTSKKMAKTAESSRRGEMMVSAGGQVGVVVGTMLGVEWVAWNGDFEQMCRTFDRLAGY
jgi:hypothetical protein